MNTYLGFMRRNAVTIALLVILLVVGAILYVQSYALSQLQEQVAGQQHIIKQINAVTGQISSNGAQRTSQIDAINAHMDCIVAFFTLSPTARAKTTVTTDQHTCTLQTATGPVVVPLPSPVATAPRASAAPVAHTTSSPTSQPAAASTPWAAPAVAKSTPKPTPSPISRFIQAVLNVVKGP